MESSVKKVVFVAIALALIAGACGSSSKNSSNSTSGGSTGKAVASPQTNPAVPVTLNESGSSLLQPFLQAAAPLVHNAFPNINLNPGGGGSGKGISDATAGTTQLGGSDAYLTPQQQGQGLLNIPVAVSSQAIDYNIPGVPDGLHLTGDLIAQIYQGKITMWNDPAIAGQNKGVNLPAMKIVPLHRQDSSGDTFIFTSFLSETNQAWNANPGFNTTVAWPNVPGEQLASSNTDMATGCQKTPGCISYVGISAQQKAQQLGLHQAQLQDKNGDWTTPTEQDVNNAVNAGVSKVPANLSAPLIYQSGSNAYPIVNFEYLIVKKAQPDPNVKQALKTLMGWLTSPTGGSSRAQLGGVQFVALPTALNSKLNAEIAQIGS